jgi:hypothetical protein
MVHYNQADTVPLTDFPYCWRFTPPWWDAPSETPTSSITALNEAVGARVHNQSHELRNVYKLYVNINAYHVTNDVSLVDVQPEDACRVKEWLLQLPIKGTEQVYVNWYNDAAVALLWEHFAAAWDCFWYPFDILTVFDDSMNWAVLLGPEEWAVYIERGSVSVESSAQDRDSGKNLIRPFPQDYSI